MRITLDKASELLRTSHVIGVPTETVYGLAASMKCPDAIENIFALKGRPANNPLIIHLSSPSEIDTYALDCPSNFYLLAEAFWPGPLTIILPARTEMVPSIVRAGLSTAAFRIPAHPLALSLINRTGPLVMPSANLSGMPSATRLEHVEKDFGPQFPVLDGGECLKGVESTILFWQGSKWIVVRLGALAPEVFMTILGYVPEVSLSTNESNSPICPGQMYRHYAPRAQLTLVSNFSPDFKGTVIGFSDRNYSDNTYLISLGVSSNPEMASQRLYAALRQLDEETIDQAWVDVNFPEEGLWLTLKERLYKASKG